MKLGIFSHCTIDEIQINQNLYEVAGGPACYCSLAAKNMNFNVDLITKFGYDFTFSNKLLENKINFENNPSRSPTTRFKLQINNSDKTLWLKQICEQLEYQKINADGILVSPVFNEISLDTFEKIKSDSNMVFVDPQGFLSRIDSEKKIFLQKTNLNLSKVSVIKVDPNEVFNLSGMEGMKGIVQLCKQVKHVLYTNKQDVSLFYGNKEFSIRLPNLDIYDTTGVGDIFTATFCCTLIKENDALWALCFAGGAAQAALESKQIGLDKVPPRQATEVNAAYFYNTLKFRDV